MIIDGEGEMIRPYVSVVMPAFNVERTIRESIESVIRQSYDNWELIIIEYQSADTTPRIIK